jgi:hypothetical protein
VTEPAARDPAFRAILEGWHAHQERLLACLQHGTEIARILRDHGLPTLDL